MRVNGGEVLKEKNLVMFIPEGKEKGYKLDINTGILYGLGGKELSSYPSFVVKACNELEELDNENTIMIVKNFNIMRHRKDNWGDYRFGLKLEDFHKTNLLLVADKIINALGNISFYKATAKDLEFINENFTNFVSYMNNDEIYPTDNKNTKLIKYSIYVEDMKLMKKYNADKYCKFTQSFLKELIRRSNYSSELNITEEEIKVLCWYAEYQLRYFFNNDIYGAINQVIRYIYNIRKLNEPIVKKGNFMSVYNAVAREVEMRQAEFDRKALSDKYNQHINAWGYETDKYMVVIPETPEDFIEEGKQQSNCVSSYANRVMSQGTRCWVVFLREKENPKKSFLTVEVSTRENNTPYISQFLLKHNQRIVGNIELEQLRADFSNYLVENWN